MKSHRVAGVTQPSLECLTVSQGFIDFCPLGETKEKTPKWHYILQALSDSKWVSKSFVSQFSRDTDRYFYCDLEEVRPTKTP